MSDRQILAILIGALLSGWLIRGEVDDVSKWEKVGGCNIEVLDMEIELEKLGFVRFDDFLVTIDYSVEQDGTWVGYMTNFHEYHCHLYAANPNALAAIMNNELLTIQKFNQ